MVRIRLIRHPETNSNAEDKIPQAEGEQLSQVGYRHIELLTKFFLADAFEDYKLFTGTNPKHLLLAEKLKETNKFLDYYRDDRFNERDFGALVGHTKQELLQQFHAQGVVKKNASLSDLLRQDLLDKDGKPLFEHQKNFENRVFSALQEALYTEPYTHMVIVTSKGNIISLLARLFDRTPEEIDSYFSSDIFSNSSSTILEYDYQSKKAKIKDLGYLDPRFKLWTNGSL